MQNKEKINTTFIIYFTINSEEDLIYLDNIVDKNYYTLNQNLTNYAYLNNFNEEIILIDFTNKTKIFVTHNENHIIPFETIYFKLFFDENTSHSGKIMGYNFLTKK